MNRRINLKVKDWHTPATDYPRAQVGEAEISEFEYDPGIYEMYGLRGFRYYQVTKKIRVTSLLIGGKVWMVDDVVHQIAMEDHAKLYHGHVVCAGLGLGLIVHELAKNPLVTKITVVERSADVIKMVKPLVPECTILHMPFDEYAGTPDGVFYDLFVGDGKALIAVAIRERILLAERFPRAKVLRIHGFNNDYLNSVSQVVDFRNTLNRIKT